jgi:hypothetical protein
MEETSSCETQASFCRTTLLHIQNIVNLHFVVAAVRTANPTLQLVPQSELPSFSNVTSYKRGALHFRALKNRYKKDGEAF